MDEFYCINPKCDCKSVKINLVKIEDKQIKDTVVEFFVNLDNQKIYDINLILPEYDVAYLISEFKKSLGDFIPKFQSHYLKAKQYGSKGLNAHDNKEVLRTALQEGGGVSYSEVFKNINLIEMEYEKDTYIIDDQYCIQPKCHCQEAILSFIKIDRRMNFYSNEFTIHFHFNTNHFDVIDSKIEDSVLNGIVKNMIQNRKDLLKLYKERYLEMKQMGRSLLEETQKPIRSNKIGRNQPCPCGSGKKYKHCCGK